MQMDISRIMQRIPHRYPFLLVDRVLSCEPDVAIQTLKNISVNEPFFQGHFPSAPIYPGVLIIETMAQSTAILSFETLGGYDHNNAIFMLVGLEETRFKKQVVPGDQLKVKAEIIRKKRNVWRFAAQATVDDQVVASSILTGALAQPG